MDSIFSIIHCTNKAPQSSASFCITQALGSVSAHVVPYSVVIQQTLNGPHCADCHILVPELLLRESHDVLLGNAANDTLNLGGIHSSARGDDLTTNVFCHRGGTVEGKEDGCLQLRFGPFGLGFADVEGEPGPFAQGEVDQVVDLGFVFGDQVDPPKAARRQ